jgi:hypothetical protein
MLILFSPDVEHSLRCILIKLGLCETERHETQALISSLSLIHNDHRKNFTINPYDPLAQLLSISIGSQATLSNHSLTHSRQSHPPLSRVPKTTLSRNPLHIKLRDASLIRLCHARYPLYPTHPILSTSLWGWEGRI